jgi:hypothetical protein
MDDSVTKDKPCPRGQGKVFKLLFASDLSCAGKPTRGVSVERDV